MQKKMLNHFLILNCLYSNRINQKKLLESFLKKSKKIKKFKYKINGQKMSVLQLEPSLSISTNQCKQRFLMNEIQSMKATKEIYQGIFQQLRAVLRETPEVENVKKMRKDIEDQYENNCIQEENSNPHILVQPQSTLQPQHLTTLNDRITKLTNTLQQRINSYCTSSISQNIVKYLQIEKQQHQLHPIIIQQLSTYIKSNERTLAQREKQLQQIQDMKYAREHSNKQQKESNAIKKQKSSEVQIDRKSTEKSIALYDFNRKLLEVVKKEITLLKLKKRRLSLQIDQKKNLNAQKKATRKEKSQNLHQLKNPNKLEFINPQNGQSEEWNNKKTSGLKISSLYSQQPVKVNTNYKNDTSPFERIVMIYQKKKFLNLRIQEQILKLQKKIINQRQQNHFLIEKTSQLQKQIEKLEWTKVCDSSFAPIHHKKFDKQLDLSILDRTLLKTCDQQSIEYSQMSINQSMIKKI